MTWAFTGEQGPEVCVDCDPPTLSTRRCRRTSARAAGQIEELFAAIERELDAVDILVNNAGAPWKAEDFVEATPERWRQTLAAEIEGPAYLARRALTGMRARRWGRIVNIGIDFRVLQLLIDTTYGHTLERFPYPFAIAKGGRHHLAEVLAQGELKYGVTVNCIEPGIIEETSLADALELSRDPAHDARPYATPTDVANVVVYLCGTEARFVTNSVIRVPGNVYSRLHR